MRRLVALFAALVSLSVFGKPPPILLAHVLPADVDVSAYLVSEKYDGVRAIWDGTTLRFRSGRVIAAPPAFLEKLPTTPLDGELWLGRRTFDTLSGIVRSDPPDAAAWANIRYMIFELPDAPGTFAQRVEKMHEIVKKVPSAQISQLEVAPQSRVRDRAELNRRLNAIVRAGAEGLMLHRADAPYVTGRSDALYKLKPLLDTEAEVIAHQPGQGKHVGRLGALVVQTPSGVVFKLGTGFSDAQRVAPPPVGATVTYTYRELSASGKPRFASFLRVRNEP